MSIMMEEAWLRSVRLGLLESWQTGKQRIGNSFVLLAFSFLHFCPNQGPSSRDGATHAEGGLLLSV